MAAPTTWGSPSSGGTVGTYTPTVNARLSYAGGYWLAYSHSGSSLDEYKIRYATDPAGAWTTITLPTPPTGYSYQGAPYSTSGVDYDGSNYAVLVTLRKTGSSDIQRILYATDPTGSWSLYDHDATNAYRMSSLRYLNGEWVLVGRLRSGYTAAIGYCSTLTGTYNYTSSSTDTGHGTGYDVTSIDFAGSTYVSCSDDGTGTAGKVLYSSTLIGGWAAPTSCTVVEPSEVRAHSNGYWTVVDGDDVVRHASDPSATWGTVTATDLGLATNAVQSIAYSAQGCWIAAGGPVSGTYRVPTITYLAGTASPAGTYTTASDGFTEPASNVQARNVAVEGSYVVAVSDYYAELRYSNLLTTATPTLLRQRQSPKRAPSRVSWKVM